MLNTFFFGYLPLKWKRLARVLSVSALFVFVAITGEIDNPAMILVPIIIVLVSFCLKPFVVK